MYRKNNGHNVFEAGPSGACETLEPARREAENYN